MSNIDVFKTGYGIAAYIDDNYYYDCKDIVEYVANLGTILDFDIVNDKLIIKFNSKNVIVQNDAIEQFCIELKTNKIFLDNYKKFCDIKKKGELNKTNKKVKRSNKYARRRITAVTACVIALSTSSILLHINSKDSNKEEPATQIIVTDDVEDTKETTTEYIPDTDYQYVDEYNNDNCIYIDYEDNSLEEKAINCKNNYYDIIKKYATMYGVDPKIMLGIATQERGTHSSEIDDSGAIGLMQLEVGVWENSELTAYNYETQEFDTYTLDIQSMSELDNNIKYSCMIFQNCLGYMNYNIPASIQCYNFGITNMKNILNEYKYCEGISDDPLNDKLGTDWLAYRNRCNQGDSQYVEHVLSWIGQENNFTFQSKNGPVECSIKAEQKNKVY